MNSDRTVLKQEIWNIPYIDQPADFWKKLKSEYGQHIKEVYFPVPDNILPSGRPVQPAEFLDEFLKQGLFNVNILVNPVVLPQPVEKIAPAVIDHLKDLCNKYKITSCTITNVLLAKRIKDAIPGLEITASVLMDIYMPYQLEIIKDIFHTIVPSSRILRNLPALQNLRKSFKGKIRLIVNEGCLPGCPFRIQHFFEMGSKLDYPESLCKDTLIKDPWLRLTGSWILPQHLYLFDGIYDELKLSGRVTLQNSSKYMKVLGAYIKRQQLLVNEIGGGPASLLLPIHISDSFYKHALTCLHQCNGCDICKNYFNKEKAYIT